MFLLVVISGSRVYWFVLLVAIRCSICLSIPSSQNLIVFWFVRLSAINGSPPPPPPRPPPPSPLFLCTDIHQLYIYIYGLVRETLLDLWGQKYGSSSYTFRSRSYTFRQWFYKIILVFHTFLHVPCKPSSKNCLQHVCVSINTVFEHVPLRSWRTPQQIHGNIIKSYTFLYVPCNPSSKFNKICWFCIRSYTFLRSCCKFYAGRWTWGLAVEPWLWSPGWQSWLAGWAGWLAGVTLEVWAKKL